MRSVRAVVLGVAISLPLASITALCADRDMLLKITQSLPGTSVDCPESYGRLTWWISACKTLGDKPKAIQESLDVTLSKGDRSGWVNLGRKRRKVFLIAEAAYDVIVDSVEEVVVVRKPNVPWCSDPEVDQRHREVGVNPDTSKPRFLRAPNASRYFPELSRTPSFGALVNLRAVIGRDGRVRDPCVLSSSPSNMGFAPLALDASTEAEFRPAKLKGEPIEMLFTFPVQFDARYGRVKFGK